MSLLLTNIGRLYTASERGVLTSAALLVEGGHVAWIGSANDRRSIDPDDIVDVEGALVTPGLVDAHTHPVYAGNRFPEIAARSSGATYEEVTAAGGGIRSTVAATRACPDEALARLVRRRLGAWLAAGTTTVEAKTGYHLDRAGELRAVALLAALADGVQRTDWTRRATDAAYPVANDADAEDLPLLAAATPRVEVTFLAAHDVDPDRACEDDAYDRHADAVASWCGDAHQAGARFVDVFCDAGYFDLDQSRRILRAGRTAGLLPRLHADELERTGAALLAAELGAVSADHLLCATDDDAKALAAAGVVATLCPVTAMAMGRLPPTRALVDHRVTVALGSDHNPGQSGTTNMSLVVGLAIQVLGLSVDEALTAATAGGAAAMRAPDRGALRPGMVADLVVWDTDHEAAFAFDLGHQPRQVYLGGHLRAGAA